MGNVAILVDYENIHINLFNKFKTEGFDIQNLPREIRAIGQEYGRIVFCKAYGDWTTRSKAIITSFGNNLIECKHVFPKANGQDRSDVSIVIEAMELLYTRKDIATYVLFSGDSDFRELALKIQNREKAIVVCAFTLVTSEDLMNAADYHFIPLEERLKLERLEITSLLKTPNIDWKPLIKAVARLNWDYIGWSAFRKKYLEMIFPEINWNDIGTKDSEGNKDDFLEAAVTEGIIETYRAKTDNGDVAAIRLNNNHELVQQVLSAIY